MGASTSPWPRALPLGPSPRRRPLQGQAVGRQEAPASYGRLESHPGSGRRGSGFQAAGSRSFQSGCKVGQVTPQGLETAPGPRQARAGGSGRGCGAAGRAAGGRGPCGRRPDRGLQPVAPTAGLLHARGWGQRLMLSGAPASPSARPQQALGNRQGAPGRPGLGVHRSQSEVGHGGPASPRCPPPPPGSANQWASVPTRQSLWRLDSWVRKGRRFIKGHRGRGAAESPALSRRASSTLRPPGSASQRRPSAPGPGCSA